MMLLVTIAALDLCMILWLVAWRRSNRWQRRAAMRELMLRYFGQYTKAVREIGVSFTASAELVAKTMAKIQNDFRELLGKELVRVRMHGAPAQGAVRSVVANQGRCRINEDDTYCRTHRCGATDDLKCLLPRCPHCDMGVYLTMLYDFGTERWYPFGALEPLTFSVVTDRIVRDMGRGWVEARMGDECLRRSDGLRKLREVDWAHVPVPAQDRGWYLAPGCKEIHPYGEDGWRPAGDRWSDLGVHEHLWTSALDNARLGLR